MVPKEKPFPRSWEAESASIVKCGPTSFFVVFLLGVDFPECHFIDLADDLIDGLLHAAAPRPPPGRSGD